MNHSKKAQNTTKSRRYPMIFATIVAFFSVCTAGVSTYAWFQAEASATISSTSSSTNINVSAPDAVKFYYFKGNGTPGGDYTGYSASGASFGNQTNTVNTSDGTFNIGGDDIDIDTFSNAWERIDIDSTSTTSGVASRTNCFNFSKMRPGCYYSFCIDVQLSTSTLTANFSWTTATSGYGCATPRYVYDGGTTSYPLNLLMAVHGYCEISDDDDATTYITNTLGTSLTDRITYTNSTSATTSEAFTLLSSGDTSSNHYIYFTIFMGKSDRSDALMYVETSNGNAYYSRNNSSGSYSPLEGLSSTLASLVVS